MDSVWMETPVPPTHDALVGTIDTDVLIIGGGITGVLCAYFLKEQGIDYALVEAKEIGHGITCHTTAKITSQHGLVYDRFIRENGLQQARQYLQANQLAIEKYKALSLQFPCDFEEKSAFVYTMDNEHSLQREMDAINKMGFEAALVSEIPLPIENAGAIRFDKQAQFHPLKFLYGISKDLHIYEHTFVKRVKKNTIVTDQGKIKAKRIVIATHFPFINAHGCYFMKMYQHRSYVIALENAQQVDGMYVDEKETGMSFRNYGNLLLIGGGDHRTGKTGGGWAELRRFAKKAYPDSVERYAWATQDCMTLDGIPYIGQYAKSTPHLHVATGFNKWGMSSAMVSAMLLSDMLANRENAFCDVFLPDRSMLKTQLVANAFETFRNLCSLSTKRCPHMGCALKWNALQHSWDCPCHGSRFAKDGSIIDNPATQRMRRA